MEENQKQNNQSESNKQEQSSKDSLFLKQIQNKREQYSQEHTEKKSVFQGFKKTAESSETSLINKKSSFSILAVFGVLGVLFLLFVLLMTAIISLGGNNNALLIAFNIDGARFKDILSAIINSSFGLTGFISLIVFVTFFFRFSVLKKEEKEKRKLLFKSIAFSLGYLIFVLFLWIATYGLMQQVKLDVPLNQLKIQTTPENVSDLHAPVDVEFDANEIITTLFNRKLAPESLGWDFNADGIPEVTLEDTSVQHRFEQEGSYNVGLIVNLKDGGTEKFSVLVNVVEASFLASPLEGPAPLSVEFDASALERKDTPAAKFEWDFDGDGVYDIKETKAVVNYVFEKIGTYKVKLRIIDIYNNFRIYEQVIDVYKNTNKNLEAKINLSPDSKGIAPFRLNLDAADSISLDGKIQKFEWDLGDGSAVQYGNRISHTYKNPGTYKISLVIYNASGSIDRTSVDVNVQASLSAPLAKIKTTPAVSEQNSVLSGVIPFKVAFDGGLSEDQDNNIIEYAWDFDGDGEVDHHGQKTDYIFETAGIYNVKLTVKDADDQVNEAIITVKVEQQALAAVLIADPLSGSLPLSVSFDASTSVYKDGKIVTYEWDFADGDGKEFGDAKRTHVYEREGRYTVTLKVFTNDGKTAMTQADIFVRAMQLQSCFSYNPKQGSAPLSVSFDSSCSKGEVSKWKWDFGDGFISTGHSPKHTFSNAGEYEVNLEIMDNKNNVSTFKSLLVVE